MKKSSTIFRYNPPFQNHQQQQTLQKYINGKTNSLNREDTTMPSAYKVDDNHSCFCFESDDDSDDRLRLKNAKRKIARNCVCNIIICAILVAYTFVGAIIFLAIEGGSDFYSFTSATTAKSFSSSSAIPSNLTFLLDPNMVASTWLTHISEESRARTVENIWDITVGLNILYRENWTRLVALEISRYQEQLVQDLAEEMSTKSQPAVTKQLQVKEKSRSVERNHNIEWNLAKAFLYSLTVLTTIGYGNSAPRTTLGKAVTMGFAAVGIPLMLLYLSSVGSLLSNCTRGVFTRSLCCCLCSNCGYCCYDERRMQEKERRMRKKREQKEYEQQMQTLRHHQEPFYVRAPSSPFSTSNSNNHHSPAPVESDRTNFSTNHLDLESLSADISITDNRDLSGSCLAPLSFCFVILVVYISGGAFVLCHLETSWTYLDGIFFCFMTLSTIGFGDAIPPSSVLSTKIKQNLNERNLIFWFCSVYILIGMALTAMCFNVVHNVIVHRLNHHYKETAGSNRLIKETSVSSKQDSASSFLESDTIVKNSVEYPVTS